MEKAKEREELPAHKDVPVVVVVDPRMNIYIYVERTFSPLYFIFMLNSTENSERGICERGWNWCFYTDFILTASEQGNV